MDQPVHCCETGFELVMKDVGDAARAGAKFQNPELLEAGQSFKQPRSEIKNEFVCFNN